MKWFLPKSWIIFVIALAAVLVLLLRENEQKMSATSRYENLKSRVDTISAEKDGAIEELETQVELLNSKLNTASDQYQFLQIEKDRIEQELGAKLDERQAELNQLHTALEEQKKQYALSAEKLKAAMAKEEDWLAQKKALVAENKSYEDRVEQLRKAVNKLEEERGHLLEALKVGSSTEAPEAVAETPVQEAPATIDGS